MKKSAESSETLLAIAAGVVSGIRSTGGLRKVLADKRLANKLYWAEAIADQLPFIPSRTQAISLLGRAASGAYVASTLARSQKSRWKLATTGAISAAVSTFAITALRKKALKRGRVAGSLAGLAENGAVLLMGRVLER